MSASYWKGLIFHKILSQQEKVLKTLSLHYLSTSKVQFSTFDLGNLNGTSVASWCMSSKGNDIFDSSKKHPNNWGQAPYMKLALYLHQPCKSE